MEGFLIRWDCGCLKVCSQ